MSFDEWLKANQAEENAKAQKEQKKEAPKAKSPAPKKTEIKKAVPKKAAKPAPQAQTASPMKKPEPIAATPTAPQEKPQTLPEAEKLPTPQPAPEQVEKEKPPAETAPAEEAPVSHMEIPAETAPPTKKTATEKPEPDKETTFKKEEDGGAKPAGAAGAPATEEKEGSAPAGTEGASEKEGEKNVPGFAGTTGTAEKEAEVHGHEEGLVAPFGLTGGWGGARKKFLDHGITIKGLYTGEVGSNYSGGPLNKTATMYHDNLDLTLSIDTEKAGLWPGGTLWIYGLRDHGPDPSSYTIGDLQKASNIGAFDQFIINEAWINQDFIGGRVSVLAGLHNMNSEFLVATYGAIFINSSFGIQPEVSQNVNVSIFPMSGLGARLRVKPSENSYVQAAVYNGNPTARELPVTGAFGDFRVAEAGLINNASDYKVGYWNHTAPKTRDGRTFDGDYGFYGIVDQQLVQFDNAEHSAVSVFVQYGWVPAERNDVTGYLGGGLHLHGLIPGRAVDDLGFAVAQASTHQDAETVYEVTYRLVLTDWLAIRPDYQWIQNPGGSSANNTANVAFLRFEVQL